MVKYVFDTNLYVRASRDPVFQDDLKAFQARHAPRVNLSSVVLHEVLIGATSPAHRLAIYKGFARFDSLPQRIITPSHAAWARAGDALSILAIKHGMERHRMPRAFVNDALIAASCAESGVTILTDNLYDFERLAEHIPVRFAPPWPTAR